MKPGTRTHGAASLRLSYSQLVPANLRGGLLELSHLVSHVRRSGHATELLKRVCAEADKAGVMLMILVDPDPADPEGMGPQELKDWYSRRFGFNVLQETPTIMIRYAHRLTISESGVVAHG